MEETEKREAITELLMDVTEEPTGTVIDSVFEFWNKLKQDEEEKEQEEKEKTLKAAKGMRHIHDAAKLWLIVCDGLDHFIYFLFLFLFLFLLDKLREGTGSIELNAE